MTVKITYTYNNVGNSTNGKSRYGAIAKKTRQMIELAVEEANRSLTTSRRIGEIRIFSGGQPAGSPLYDKNGDRLPQRKPAIAIHGGGKGSTRHDFGGAADVHLYDTNGNRLDYSTAGGKSAFLAFAGASAKYGATGIGFGSGYMGTKTIHVGFGNEANWGGMSAVMKAAIANGRANLSPKALTWNGVDDATAQMVNLGFVDANGDPDIKAFQRSVGLIDDGVVEQKTQTAAYFANVDVDGHRVASIATHGGMNATQAPPPPPSIRGRVVPIPANGTLRFDDDGEDIKILQERLKAAGFDPGPIDGDFGTRTESAVKAFQNSVGVNDSGEVDTDTWKAIDTAINPTGRGRMGTIVPYGPPATPPSPSPSGTLNYARESAHRSAAAVNWMAGRMDAADDVANLSPALVPVEGQAKDPWPNKAEPKPSPYGLGAEYASVFDMLAEISRQRDEEPTSASSVAIPIPPRRPELPASTTSVAPETEVVETRGTVPVARPAPVLRAPNTKIPHVRAVVQATLDNDPETLKKAAELLIKFARDKKENREQVGAYLDAVKISELGGVVKFNINNNPELPEAIPRIARAAVVGTLASPDIVARSPASYLASRTAADAPPPDPVPLPRPNPLRVGLPQNGPTNPAGSRGPAKVQPVKPAKVRAIDMNQRKDHAAAIQPFSTLGDPSRTKSILARLAKGDLSATERAAISAEANRSRVKVSDMIDDTISKFSELNKPTVYGGGLNVQPAEENRPLDAMFGNTNVQASQLAPPPPRHLQAPPQAIAARNAPDIRRTIITSGGDLYGDTKRVRTLVGVRSTRAAYGPQSVSGSSTPPPSGGPRYSHSTGRDDKGRTVTSYTNSKGKKISFRVDGRGRTTML